MPNKLRFAAPAARAPFVLSAVAAVAWFSSAVYLALAPSTNNAWVFGVSVLALLATQLGVTIATSVFASRASRALGADRRAAASPTWSAVLLWLPLVAQFARWRVFRGLLEDTHGLVRGGGADARPHLAVFTIASGLSSLASFFLVQLVAAVFSYNEAAWLTAQIAASFMIAVPAVVAAWSGTLLVRRIELRFHDAQVRDATASSWGEGLLRPPLTTRA
jgi:hypothetical protein